MSVKHEILDSVDTSRKALRWYLKIAKGGAVERRCIDHKGLHWLVDEVNKDGKLVRYGDLPTDIGLCVDAEGIIEEAE